MFYDVKLSITYEYERPSDHSRLLLRLLPAHIPAQQAILTSVLTLDPLPAERRDCLDFFGNMMTSAVWHQPITTLALSLTAQLERVFTEPRLDLSPRLSALRAEIDAYRSLAPHAPQHYTLPSRRVQPNDEMTAFARAQLRPGQTSLQVVQAIGEALHEEMQFDAEATDVDTPAAEAFAKRHGVCQDFSHIMIACLRAVGVPAGYVSGFLRTFPPPGQPRLEGADAMHAWVKAWVGAEMGWIEFDPTNNQYAGADHITVGYGRDYDDVSPVRGTMRGTGDQESKQSVDVIPLGQG